MFFASINHICKMDKAAYLSEGCWEVSLNLDPIKAIQDDGAPCRQPHVFSQYWGLILMGHV